MRASLLQRCLVAVGLTLSSALTHAAAIEQVSYETLSGLESIGFESMTCSDGNPPQADGCSLEGIFRIGNAQFSEHFEGQTVGANGLFDTLSTPASQWLTLEPGEEGKNLFVQDDGAGVVMGGVGVLGSDGGIPFADAAGEGAISMLFDGDQSQIGLKFYGGSAGGKVFLAFFRFDGSLIGDVITLQDVGSGNGFGFARERGVKDIAGFSIWNEDTGGVSFAGLLHDVTGNRDGTGTVPEPTGLLLVAVALLGAARATRRR